MVERTFERDLLARRYVGHPDGRGLGIDAAKSVAALVAPRLPTSVAVPAAPPAAKGTGKLDPALVGSWFLTQADGRGLPTLSVEAEGKFFITLIAGNKTQSGQIDGQNGVLHVYPERGGTAQEFAIEACGRTRWNGPTQKAR